MESQAVSADGLPAELSSYTLRITRHAMDAMQHRGLTMLELVDALRSPPAKVRRDVKSGHYVVRDKGFRIVLRVDPKSQIADIITVAAIVEQP